MNTTNLKITVIVCAYTERRWDDLVKCILSIQAQIQKPDEVILSIDHNSTLFKKTQNEIYNITIIENRHEPGLSGARNTAIENALGDILVFIDEDAVAAQDWISWLTLSFANTNVMGVGGAIIPNWEKGRPAWFPDQFDWVVGCSYRGLPVTVEPVRNLIGCNMAIRREVFAVVGDFKEDLGRVGILPLGCEETELCIRAKQYWPDRYFLYEPRAKVAHNIPPQRANPKYFISRCYSEGISKAQVARFVGVEDGLSSEWIYSMKVLPRGFFHGIALFATKFQLAGLGESVAILGGLAVTTIGFLFGSFSSLFQIKKQRAKIHS